MGAPTTYWTEVFVDHYGHEKVRIGVCGDGRVSLYGESMAPADAARVLAARPLPAGRAPLDARSIQRGLEGRIEGVLCAMERRAPVIAEVVEELSGGYTARVYYEATGRAGAGRGITGGATYQGPQAYAQAVRDAEAWALRAAGGDASRIRHVGYTAADVSREVR